MKYEEGKIYYLRAPSDGIGSQGIARYPTGLPVRLVEKTNLYFLVEEPSRLDVVKFPLRPVWNQKIDIFAEGQKGTDPLLLSEFPSDDGAEEVWDLYANPEQNRLYVDELRSILKKNVYSDWEAGWSEGGIRNILEAARLLMTDPLGNSEYHQSAIDAVCDIALLIYEGDAPGWCEEISKNDNLTEVNYEIGQEAAYHVVNTVLQLMDHDYFVKSTGTWNLKERKFQHKDFKVESFQYKDFEAKA